MSQGHYNLNNNDNNEIDDIDNDNEQTIAHQFYEYGAHFKYEDLYNQLKELKKNFDNMNHLNNNRNSSNNPNRIPPRSRNIQLNNQIRSINIYLKDKSKNKNGNNPYNLKTRTNKTSIFPKTEGIKHKLNCQIEKISNGENIMKKNNNIKLNNKKRKKNKSKDTINNKKVEAKSTSHPKRTNLVTFSNLFKNNNK